MIHHPQDGKPEDAEVMTHHTPEHTAELNKAAEDFKKKFEGETWFKSVEVVEDKLVVHVKGKHKAPEEFNNVVVEVAEDKK